jgi:D-sedoheptulose 7-phosphate isomerase
MPRFSAIVNDYNWNEVFTRQLQHIQTEDILILISVHGGSDSWSNNLVNAAEYAIKSGAMVLSFTGFDGGKLKEISDFNINVTAQQTFQIEGIHLILIHIICQMLDDQKCSK